MQIGGFTTDSTYMKKIVFILLIASTICLGQSSDATLTNQVQTTIRGLTYSPSSAGNMFQGLINSKASRVEANATAGTNTYTVSIPWVTSYAFGLTVPVQFTIANTGASTININSLGAKAIVKSVSSPLVANDILANQIFNLWYDGTNFQQIGGSGGITASNGLNLVGSDLRLGGSLIVPTTISGTITNNLLFDFSSAGGVTSQIKIDPSLAYFYTSVTGAANAQIATRNNGGSAEAVINVQRSTGQVSTLTISDNTFGDVKLFSNSTGFKGLQESSDYSSGYVPLSLVNKNYSDTHLLGGLFTGTSGQIPFVNATADGYNYSGLITTDLSADVALGYNALASVIVGGDGGDYNSAFGASSLYSSTGGSYNSAMGASSLYSSTTAISNSAMGASSLYSSTTGFNNSAMGASSLYSSTTGFNNSAMGVSSLYSSTTGFNNSAMGAFSLYFNTTGNDNIAFGNYSGSLLLDDSQNNNSNQSIFIGSLTKSFYDSQTNEIVIGYNATGLGSNTLVLGNNSIVKTALRGEILFNGSGGTGGQVLISGGAGFPPTWATVTGTGTVTSVGLSMPSIFTVTGSPITGAGTLAASLNSQTANTFFASPNGAAGVPVFRGIVAADIPTLNQNTTGSSATFTGALTGDVSGTQSATSVNKINGVALSGLATGYLRNTTTTGVPSSVSTIPTTDLSGVLQAAQEPAHTGDVTNTASSLALTISANAVTNAKAAQMPANTFKANNTGISANASDITTAQAKTLLAITSSDVSGLGTLATASTVNAAAQLTGIVPIANGGTGLSTIGANATVLTSNGTTASWAAPTTGITNTAANNELMKSNGTNAIPSGIFVTNFGDIQMGNFSGNGTARTIQPEGVAANINTEILAKGSGNVTLGNLSFTNQVSTRSINSFLHTYIDASTIVMPSFTSVRQTTATPIVGIGSSISSQIQTAIGIIKQASFIETVSTNVGIGTEAFDFVLKNMNGGATASEKLRIKSTGEITFSGGAAGTTGQVLSGVTGGAPVWSTPATTTTYFSPSVLSIDATDADFTAVVNSIKYLPVSTLTANRNITIPTGANGDYLEINNNETAFVWNLIGAQVFLADRTTVVTSLLYNVPTLMRKVSGKWIILN
jgi:trimeric autotransporter adhesin